MSITRTLTLLLAATAPMFASDPISMKIQVVDTAITETQSNTGASVFAGRSVTKCDAPTAYPSSSTNSSGCSSTGVSGSVGHSADKSILQMNVHAILPDGTHVTLRCQTAMRHCVSLSPGEYLTEVKGNDAWVHIPKMDGTDDKVKYRSIGGW